MKSSRTYILAAQLLILSLLLSTSCVRDNIEHPAPSDKTAKVTFALKLPDNNIPTTDTRALDKPAEEKVDDITVIAFKDDKFYFTAYHKTAVINNMFTVDLIKGDYEIMLLANVRKKVSALKFNVGDSKASVEAQLKYVLNDTAPKWVTNTALKLYRHIPMSSSIRAVKIEENLSFKGVDAFVLHRILAKININVTNTDPKHSFKLTSVHLYNYNLEGYMTPKFDAVGKTVPNTPTQTKQLGPIEYKFAETTSYTNEIYLLEVLNNTNPLPPTLPTPLAAQTCIVIGGKYNGTTYYYRIDFNYKDADDKLQYINFLRNHRYEVNVNKIGGVGYGSFQEAYDAGSVNNVESEIIVWNDSKITYVKSDGRYSIGVEKESVTIPFETKSKHELLVISKHIKEPTLKISSSPTDADAGGVTWMTNPILKIFSVSDGMKRYNMYYDTSENISAANRIGYIHITAGTIHLVVTVVQEYMKYLRFTKKVGDVWVEIDSLIFAQDSKDVMAGPQTVRIEWAPKSNTPALSSTPTGGEYKDIVWYGGNRFKNPIDNDESERQGQQENTVQPKLIADYVAGSFTEAQTTLNLSWISGKGDPKGLVIHQYVKEVYIVAPTVLPMDGGTRYLTVKSNVPWELYANKNISSGIGTPNVRVVQSVGTALDLSEMNNVETATTVKVFEGKHNLPDGIQVPITTVDDIFTKNEIYQGTLNLYGRSTESATVKATKSILCASGIKQDGREANCYVLNPESGIGLLIPVRAANGHMTDTYKTNGGTALYNKDDADVTIIADGMITNNGVNSTYGARLVWADEAGGDVAGGKGKGLAEDALLNYVLPVVKGTKGYVLVLPGAVKKEGNAVVAVTRNEDGTGDILWSWHIWVTKGMKFEGGDDMKTRIMPGHNGAGPLTEYWLDRNLGALNNGGVGKTDMYTYGMHYQWGRKDPFPNINKTVAVIQGEDNERQLYDANGPLPMSGLHGCVSCITDGTTVQKSVQTPLTFYYLSKKIGEETGVPTIWLEKYIGTLWGVTFGGEYDIIERGEDLGKSIFDPCPAGYRIPVRISKGSADNSNTKHWGNEIEDIGGAGLLQNLKTDHGFQWPSSTTPYKGGWYPSASLRYVKGLNTVGGNESNGQYWSSNSVFFINHHRGRIMNFSEIPKKIIPSNQILPYAGGSARCVAQ